MRKWAAGFLVLAAALLFYVACGDNPTSPGLDPATGPFGPATGPFGPATGPFGPGGGGGGGGGTNTPTPTKTTTATPTGTTTPNPTPTPYTRITSVVFVASGAVYNVVVDPNGVSGASIYTDQTNFVVGGLVDPELVSTAFADAFLNSDPLAVLNLSERAVVTVWTLGADPPTPSSFLIIDACPTSGSPEANCWKREFGASVTDLNNPNFLDIAIGYARIFDPGPVQLGPRAVDNPPADGSPQMYFIGVQPCNFPAGTYHCP